MQRPRISLDGLAEAIDRMLAHPLAQIVEEVSPDSVEALRELRSDLPSAFAGLERLAVERMVGSSRRVVDELGQEIRDAVHRAVWAGRRAPERKRLAPAKKKRKAGR